MTLRFAMSRRHAFFVQFLFAALVLLLPLALPPPVAQAETAAPPKIWLPTPVGQRWQILQGFYCGSHVGRQSRSLDFVNLDGATSGAPVRAVADGTTFVWEGSTGTLILSHGSGYYSLYSHMYQPIAVRRGLDVRQGDVIGRTGSVGTGVPHLHFNFFYAPDSGAYNRRLLELNFADGYSFRDTSGCNQHRGEVVVARGNPDTTAPVVEFSSTAQSAQWYCSDQRVEFHVKDDRSLAGFTQAFNRDPSGTEPEVKSDVGYMQVAWAGEGLHTINVRAWDSSGLQTLATFGPIGYDVTAPTLAAPEVMMVQTQSAGTPLTLSWTAASDGAGSGVAGYRLYLGPDNAGTSDWFSAEPQVQLEGLTSGRYFLRAQALDRACGKSAWVTLQEIVAQ